MLQIIQQPFSTDNRLGDVLISELENKSWTQFDLAVAFVKQSGVKFLYEGIRAFATERAVNARVGIDLNGTSLEGLSLLRDAVSPQPITIIHSAGVSTFHPKIYAFRNDRAAKVILGSGNLTAGGLFTNFEGCIAVALDLSEPVHSSFLNSLDGTLDEWSNCGAGKVLDDELLANLERSGLVIAESKIPKATEQADTRQPKTASERPLFEAIRVPNPPSSSIRIASRRRSRTATEPAEAKQTALTGFVMTLQRTDVGTGQTSAGASRRSPEVFVPLAARDYDPTFWGWPDEFVEDASRPGKLDRHGVMMRLGGEVIEVNMMTWPVKHDFRLRSEALRSAGEIGDILRLEVAGADKKFDYYATIIPVGSSEYSYYESICTNTVRNSARRWGYY